jgi:hypothetical protein
MRTRALLTAWIRLVPPRAARGCHPAEEVPWHHPPPPGESTHSPLHHCETVTREARPMIGAHAARKESKAW